MMDISKCLWTDCPLASSCWRIQAPEHEFSQSWIAPQTKGEGCQDYIEVNDEMEGGDK